MELKNNAAMKIKSIKKSLKNQINLWKQAKC